MYVQVYINIYVYNTSTRVRMVSDMIDSGVPGQRVVAPAVKTNIPRGPRKEKKNSCPPIFVVVKYNIYKIETDTARARARARPKIRKIFQLIFTFSRHFLIYKRFVGPYSSSALVILFYFL